MTANIFLEVLSKNLIVAALVVKGVLSGNEKIG